METSKEGDSCHQLVRDDSCSKQGKDESEDISVSLLPPC
jgi:hypothetical protein